jgi:hypothetical protein
MLKNITKKLFICGFMSIAISSASAFNCTDITSNLSKGSKNNEVLKLQLFLFDSGYLTIKPNGYFGNGTVTAIKKFQLINKLPAVGSAGPATRNKIKDLSCPLSTKVKINTASSSGITAISVPVISQVINTGHQNEVQTSVDNQCKDDACFTKKLENCSVFKSTITSDLSITYNESAGISGEQDGRCKVFYTGEYSSKTTNRKIKYSSYCLIGKEEARMFDLVLSIPGESVRGYVRGKITLEQLREALVNSQKSSTASKYSCVYQIES